MSNNQVILGIDENDNPIRIEGRIEPKKFEDFYDNEDFEIIIKSIPFEIAEKFSSYIKNYNRPLSGEDKYKSDTEKEEIKKNRINEFKNNENSIQYLHTDLVSTSTHYVFCPTPFCAYKRENETRSICIRFEIKVSTDAIYYFCTDCMRFFRVTGYVSPDTYEGELRWYYSKDIEVKAVQSSAGKEKVLVTPELYRRIKEFNSKKKPYAKTSGG